MSSAPRRAETILRRLEWTVIRRLDGLLQGDYRTLFRGFGVDLADLREYQFHDDVRNIDWNVTARMQVPYVREFNEDREITAWFLLDVSPSVDFGSLDTTKRSVLAEFVAVLSRLFTRHGNRVGVIAFDGKVDLVIPPGSGRRHVLHILTSLIEKSDSPPGPTTDLGELLKAAQGILRRRALVFLVSDFISAPGWSDRLGILSQRHELLAVRLFDPLEMDLPELGMMVMRDAETGENLFVDTTDRGFRERFAALALEREEELRGSLRRAGVDTLELSTEDEMVETLLRFADLRTHRSRASVRLPDHLGGRP
jgi:uncharacterized protein (DUF58 family)